MRKLTIFVLVGLLLIGGAFSVAADSDKTDTGEESASNFDYSVDAGFTVEYIAAIYVNDNDVDLGTLDSDDYDMDSDGGSWADSATLKSESHTVAAFANTDYDLQVSAEDAGGDADYNSLNDSSSFQMKGGGNDYQEVIGSENSFDLVSDSDPGSSTVNNVGYKYEPDPADGPGEYKVSVTYTISTS